MIDGLRLISANLKQVPASDRKRLIQTLRAHGHTCEALIHDYADVAELIIDGAGGLHVGNWDGDYSTYSVKYLALTPWTYELLLNVLDQAVPGPSPSPPQYHCGCQMTLEGIVHQPDCRNWVNLTAQSIWGIPCSKK